MPVTTDIVASYRRPAQVMRRLLSAGTREDRALAMLMAGCVLAFISQLPRLSREAHLTGEELNPMLGGALFAWLFIAPLMFYLIAALSHLVARLFKGKGDWFGARLALFWAFLAASPLMLLNGLTAGFVGPGAALTLVGFVWFVAFMVIWLVSLKVAETDGPA
ncbi:Yip1 domain-containing protein [Thalassococcus halodurans]|uniref:Yip1 domain-containing protein n=1 Tax=Thalassococcus halodurans TaxID=373675 RepID=A0A1H5WDB1_9RHOB|nr:YIP1 family protein [Thalassococcus halodurans]SEF97465.1 Yip1 domain-containing protein [Thalassococcus halodurans]